MTVPQGIQNLRNILGREPLIEKNSIKDLSSVSDSLLQDFKVLSKNLHEREFFSYMRRIIDSEQFMHVDSFINDVILGDCMPADWESNKLVTLRYTTDELVTKSLSDVCDLLKGYGEIKRIVPDSKDFKYSPYLCGGLAVEARGLHYNDDSVDGTGFTNIGSLNLEPCSDLSIAFRRSLAYQLHCQLLRDNFDPRGMNGLQLLCRLFENIDESEFSIDAIKAASGLIIEISGGVVNGLPGFNLPDSNYE